MARRQARPFRHWARTAPPSCLRSRSTATISSSRTTTVSSATAPARRRSTPSSTSGESRCASSTPIRSARPPSSDISKKKLDAALAGDDPDAAGLVQGVIEEFAQELASVTRRFLRAKGWKDTERIVVGGGMRERQIGELAIGRAGVLLKSRRHQDRPAADPQPSGRCRPHRRGAARAVVDLPGARQHSRRRHRRHQHPRRRGRSSI